MAEPQVKSETPSSSPRHLHALTKDFKDDSEPLNGAQENGRNDTEQIAPETLKPSNASNGFSKPNCNDIEASKPMDRHHGVISDSLRTPKPKALPETSSITNSISRSTPVLQEGNSCASSKDILASKLKLSTLEGKGDSCKHCKELENMISLWELGVSGLTRNYSKILSWLNKAVGAAIKIEAQLKEERERKKSVSGVLMRNMSTTGHKAMTVRQSMYASPGHVQSSTAVNITEQMYPQEETRDSNLSSASAKTLKELTSNLDQAIDLCQQLAAANFKSNRRSSSKRGTLRRQVTVHSNLREEDSFRPALQSITEASVTGSIKKAPLERTPSAPESMIRRNQEETYSVYNRTEYHLEASSEATESTDSTNNSLTNQRPYSSHNRKLGTQNELDGGKSTELSEELGTSFEEYSHSVLCASSTFSDSDVKHVMSKIADLEEERVKLLTTIDDLQRDNNTVRLSLGEILGDLENKDLQLTLALQDLTVATGEIRRAAEMRKQLQNMEIERTELLERLSNLEDESAAVKISLIQLLQEKSATNKTLALENWRLNQKIKVQGARRVSSDGDNVSVTSGFSSLTEDATLQEAFMEAEDVASFVHKQGFLIKQGGRRKNWKKRLFVLSPEGLSYYKTEQPLQILPIDKIEKVQITHGRTPYPHPNIFEVHTPGRVFLLSAPTEDEMQSWVGMLQTLKQYNKGTALNREASSKRAQMAPESASPLPTTLPTIDQSDSDPEPEHKEILQHDCVTGQHGHVTKATPKQRVSVSSDEEDGIHLDNIAHGDSDIGSHDLQELGVTPRSVPSMSVLESSADLDYTSSQLLVRLRSDSN